MEVRNHMEVSGDGGGTKFIESGVGRANGYRRDISTNGRCIRLGSWFGAVGTPRRNRGRNGGEHLH
jgi:hypothetical protein